MKTMKKGSRIRISRTFKTGRTQTFEAIVTGVEDRGEFLYFGHIPVLPGTTQWDHNYGQWGYERAYKPEFLALHPFAAQITVLVESGQLEALTAVKGGA